MTEVKIEATGTVGTITIDGQPITNATAVSVDLNATELPRVTVALHPATLRMTLVDPRIDVDYDTAKLLEAMGWTPPEGTR